MLHGLADKYQIMQFSAFQKSGIWEKVGWFLMLPGMV
jgi:hypothetical protein